MATAVKQFHEEESIGKTYDWQVARRLLRYLTPYVRALIPALALTLVLNLLGILQPMFTKWAIDWHIIPAQTDASHLSGLKWLALAFLAVKLVQFVFSYFQEVLLNSVGQRVMYDLRSELYEKLQHQEVAYYDRNPVGRIMTRLTSDVDALNELFTSGVIDLLGDLVMIVAIIAIMLWMDWRLTLGALVAFIQYSQQLFQPIRDISDKYNVLQAAVVASHRIFRTLDLPITITPPENPVKTGRAIGRIELERVWFAYNDEDWVLKDVS